MNKNQNHAKETARQKTSCTAPYQAKSSQDVLITENSDDNVEDGVPASMLGNILQALHLEALQCVFVLLISYRRLY
jgi:hypothetical protein